MQYLLMNSTGCCTVASQQKDPRLDPWICVEFASSPHVRVDFLLVLQFPPTKAHIIGQLMSLD